MFKKVQGIDADIMNIVQQINYLHEQNKIIESKMQELVEAINDINTNQLTNIYDVMENLTEKQHDVNVDTTSMIWALSDVMINNSLVDVAQLNALKDMYADPVEDADIEY